MGQLWTGEMAAKLPIQQADEPDPPSASSVWIDNSDLLFRDLLRGALAHLFAVIRHWALRESPPTFSLGDQIVYVQFCRQHFEPRPEPGQNASEIEKWLAQDLDPFEGIEHFYRA
jgi:hypothetical protein